MKLFAIRSTFKVYERLKKEQHINTLFLSGKAFSVFPIRFIYNLIPANEAVKPAGTTEEHPDSQPPIPDCPLKVGFSVPKKKFRSSVHRHRVRRLMVEAWRLNKQPLIDAVQPGCHLHVFVIFTGKELPEYAQVLPVVKTGIEKLVTIVKKPNPAIK